MKALLAAFRAAIAAEHRLALADAYVDVHEYRRALYAAASARFTANKLLQEATQ